MIPLCWLLATLCAEPPSAPDSVVPTTRLPSRAPPLLLVLPGCLKEERTALMVQIRLVIEDYAIAEADETKDAACGLDDVPQADTIRAARGATAVLWLTARGDGRVRLSLLIVLGGQAMLSEHDAVPDGSGLMTMALLVREWLPPAHVLVEGFLHLPRRWRPKSPASLAPPPLAPRRPEPTYFVSAWGGVGGGLARQAGPTRMGDVALAIERTILGEPSLLAGLRVAARVGPYERRSEREIFGLGGRIGATSCYGLMPHAQVRWWPCLAFELETSRLRVRDGATAAQTFVYFTPRLALPQEVRVGLIGPLEFALRGDVGVRQNQQELKRRSDAQRLLLTPQFDWQISAGAILSLENGP